MSRRFDRDKADYIPIVTWRELAENCAKYLVKGQQAAVVGELQSRIYEDNQGNKRTMYEVSAEEVEFLARPGASRKDNFAEEIDGTLVEDETLPF